MTSPTVCKDGVADLRVPSAKKYFLSGSKDNQNISKNKKTSLGTLIIATPTINNGRYLKDNVHYRLQVQDDLHFILRHLDGSPFPRNIMTPRLNRQIEVWDEDAAIREFELSDWQDCRISAYPTFTEYHGLNFTAPSIVFIDLDLQNFKSLEALDRTLRNTLSLIQKAVDGSNRVASPTILWTGNGYHIYFPIAGFVLEQEQVFSEFVSGSNNANEVSLTTKFMRFAEQYFTRNKQDPNHRPSVNNCLLRIPGSYNSKNGQQVRIVQEWNGYKAPIQYMLREFRRYLIQERIDNNRYQQQRPPVNSSSSNQRSGCNTRPGSIGWIEELLQTPIADQRKYCIWRILAPYLVNCKQLSSEEAYEIICSWLDECNKLERLSFYHRPRIRDDIRRARRVGYYPISLSNLQKENPGLYRMLFMEP